MKQIRQGVFETNSSTQHSLTFTYEATDFDLKKIINSDTLEFGVRTPEEINKDKTPGCFAIDLDNSYSWQDRADLLFWGLLRMNSVGEFISTCNEIREVFKKRGITVKFLTDAHQDYIKEEYGEYCGGWNVICGEVAYTENENFEKNIINYIFSPNILEYSFEDNCISMREYEDLKKILGGILSSFPDNVERFSYFDR